jgi:phospholipid/cholesterol/gamma-HCH transport system substrate-binding protein
MPRTRSIAWSQLKLGVIGVVALVLLAVTILAVGGEAGFFWQRYPLKMQFRDVQGLKSGAVVRVAGKDVGTVSSVEFAGQVIEVAFEVGDEVRPLITNRSVGTVGSLSLLGESMVTITAAPEGTPLPDWGYVRTTEMKALSDLTGTAATGLETATALLADIRSGRGTIGKLMTDDALYRELQAFIESATDVTNNLNRGEGTMGRLMNDPAAYDAMKASLENLQQMTARINNGQGALGRFLNDEAMGKSLSSTMTNLETTTARLNRGEGTMGKLLTDQELYNRMSQMTTRVDELIAGLNQGQGTAGQLLRDRQLYENMNAAALEMRQLFAEIRKDPKKYLRVSVSIF